MNHRYTAYVLALGLLLFLRIGHAAPGPPEPHDATAVFGVA